MRAPSCWSGPGIWARLRVRTRLPRCCESSSKSNGMPLHEIPGLAGRLEALLDEPASRGIGADGRLEIGHTEGLRAAVVFGHPHTGYGGTMHTKVVYQAAKALSRIGCAVLRFNFRAAEPKELVVIDGADHLFDGKVAEVADAIEDLLEDWSL